MKGTRQNGGWKKIGIITTVIEAVSVFFSVFTSNVYISLVVCILLISILAGYWMTTSFMVWILKKQKEQKINNIKRHLADIEALDKDDKQQVEKLINEKSSIINRYNCWKSDLNVIRIVATVSCTVMVFILMMAGEHPLYVSLLELNAHVSTIGNGETNNTGSGSNNRYESQILKNTGNRESSLADDEKEEQIVQGMSFYLDEPNEELIPTPEKMNAVFYVNYVDADIDNAVMSHMKDTLAMDLEDTFASQASQHEKNIAAQASEEEKTFNESRKMVKQYAAEQDFDEWKKALMHSTYLEGIMDKRLNLWNSGKRSGDIAFMLANNCQAYALEYQHQNKSGYTILSYYMDSIIWSELALSYSGVDKELIFNYIKGRYWDIYTCQEIPELYRTNARTIYDAMGSYEDYNQ